MGIMKMSGGRQQVCAVCGAEISGKVPQYYIEMETFRRISERSQKIPRRGSREYHEAMDKLLPEIEEAYYRDREMFDEGHLWCSFCGGRLDSRERPDDK